MTDNWLLTVAALLLMVACGGSTPAATSSTAVTSATTTPVLTITGTILIDDSIEAGSEACSGTGGFADLEGGANVVVEMGMET